VLHTHCLAVFSLSLPPSLLVYSTTLVGLGHWRNTHFLYHENMKKELSR